MLCEDKYYKGFCARGKYCGFAHRQDELKDWALEYQMRPANEQLRPIFQRIIPVPSSFSGLYSKRWNHVSAQLRSAPHQERPAVRVEAELKQALSLRDLDVSSQAGRQALSEGGRGKAGRPLLATYLVRPGAWHAGRGSNLMPSSPRDEELNGSEVTLLAWARRPVWSCSPVSGDHLQLTDQISTALQEGDKKQWIVQLTGPHPASVLLALLCLGLQGFKSERCRGTGQAGR